MFSIVSKDKSEVILQPIINKQKGTSLLVRQMLNVSDDIKHWIQATHLIHGELFGERNKVNTNMLPKTPIFSLFLKFDSFILSREQIDVTHNCEYNS